MSAAQKFPAGKLMPFVRAGFVLNDWFPTIRKWYIAHRPVAKRKAAANVKPSRDDRVYGSVYLLTESDVKSLDRSEGMNGPNPSYVKKTIMVNLIRPTGIKVDVPAMLYVDEKNMRDGKPEQDYIDTLNKGIADGFTSSHDYYVDKYLRPYIGPEPTSASLPEEILQRAPAGTQPGFST